MANRQVLNDMASLLLETETVDGERLRELVARVARIDLTADTEAHANGHAVIHTPVPTPELPLQA
jgi:cell division protease FtsH